MPITEQRVETGSLMKGEKDDLKPNQQEKSATGFLLKTQMNSGSGFFYFSESSPDVSVHPNLTGRGPRSRKYFVYSRVIPNTLYSSTYFISK